MKFKKGDRVIKVEQIFGHFIDAGATGTVTERSTMDGTRPYVYFDHLKDDFHVNPDNYELLSVYESPLYQALK